MGTWPSTTEILTVILIFFGLPVLFLGWAIGHWLF